jgi:hypothetical protein
MLRFDPVSYFSRCELEESLLIRFVYRPQTRMLDLVIRYAAEAVSDALQARQRGEALLRVPVDFRHFRFQSVQSLQSGNGTVLPEIDWPAYERVLLAKPQVLTGVHHIVHDGQFESSFILGRFGIHRFAYERASVEARRACAIQSPDLIWIYRDSATNEIVDFNNPFPSVDAETTAYPESSDNEDAGK